MWLQLVSVKGLGFRVCVQAALVLSAADAVQCVWSEVNGVFKTVQAFGRHGR